MSFDTQDRTGAFVDGGDGIIGSTVEEINAINAFINNQNAVRRALNVGSGLTGSERFALIKSQGGTLDQSPSFRQNLLDNFGFLGATFQNADIMTILKAAEEKGIDTAEVLIRTLSEDQLFGEDLALAVTRNELLVDIKEGIENIDPTKTTQTSTFIFERGATQIVYATGVI